MVYIVILYIFSKLTIPVLKDKKKTKMEVYIAADHAGFRLKEEVKKFLKKKNNSVIDLGTKNTNSVDYPDYAHLLSKKIGKGKNQFGILVCGSGTGMSMVANKYKNIRAALCYNTKSTMLSRLHNNANVMAIGARLIKKNVALRCVDVFLKTGFDGGRHLKRLKKF